MTTRRETFPSDRLAEVAYHGTAERAVGQWRNCVNHRPEMAEVIRRELPGLVEALEGLDELVMPSGVSPPRLGSSTKEASGGWTTKGSGSPVRSDRPEERSP